jgi:hypothetical protein
LHTSTFPDCCVITKLARALVIVAGLAAGARAQIDWIERGSGLLSPREGLAMAYDSARGHTIAFGGHATTLLQDTWRRSGGTWLPTVPANSPPARADHGMVFDSQRGRAVLFGGFGGVGVGLLGDTWEWDGSTWLPTTAVGPAPRVRIAMAYDSQRGRVVLFGGFSTTQLDDTWEWNGSVWTQVAATGPAARQSHAMAYDSHRGRTVLFGGVSTGPIYTLLGDTWEWDGAAWTLVASTGPDARQAHAMAFDGQLGLTVLFGGELAGLVFGNDTWRWDGSTWSRLSTSVVPSRVDHAMAYDSQRQRTVWFGGWDGSYRNDTWELTSTTSTSTPFGQGCGNPPLSLAAVATAPPAVGSTAVASLTNIPGSLAVVALGWNTSWLGPLPLPLALLGIGMPGCVLLTPPTCSAWRWGPRVRARRCSRSRCRTTRRWWARRSTCRRSRWRPASIRATSSPATASPGTSAIRKDEGGPGPTGLEPTPATGAARRRCPR